MKFNNHPQIKCFFLLAALILPLVSQAQPGRFLAGRDYTIIAGPVEDRTPDIVEVTEFFWYGCPGCYAFEPQLADWIEKQDESVVCLRLPAIWDDWREVHARAYYTADALGIIGVMHRQVFDAMHLHGNRLRNEQELQALFVANDVDAGLFSRIYNSFTVNSQVNRARNLGIQYGALSTPSLIVNGKYLVTLSRDTLDIVDFLVQKELAGL